MVTPFFPPLVGGAENANLQLAKHLRKKGIDFHVMTTRFKPTWPKAETMEDIPVRRYPSWFPSGIPLFTDLAHSLYPFAFLPTWLDHLQPSILHIHYLYYSGYAAWQWAKSRKCPYVLTLAGDDVTDPHRSPCSYFKSLHRRMVREASGVAIPTPYLKEVLEENFNAQSKKMRVIPWGVDLGQFAPSPEKHALREKFNLPSDGMVIVSVQRLHMRKGIQILLRALELLRQRDARFTMLLVGEGSERSLIEKTVESLNLKDHVRLLGRISEDELPKVYQAADIFAMHSYHEGFGLVYLEAMASGLPIITTRSAGSQAIIKEEENGFLVPAGNAEAFADVILKLFGNASMRKQMGEQSRKIAEQTYGWPVIADRYRRMYEESSKTTENVIL